jgi:hypothetical protein
VRDVGADAAVRVLWWWLPDWALDLLYEARLRVLAFLRWYVPDHRWGAETRPWLLIEGPKESYAPYRFDAYGPDIASLKQHVWRRIPRDWTQSPQERPTTVGPGDPRFPESADAIDTSHKHILFPRLSKWAAYIEGIWPPVQEYDS